MITVAELIASTLGIAPVLPKKPMPGTCAICAQQTNDGWRFSDLFSDSFTDIDVLVCGANVVCPTCAAVYKAHGGSNRTRGGSGRINLREGTEIARVFPADPRAGGYAITDADVLYKILTSPPDPPFVIQVSYVTPMMRWVKHVWLRSVVNLGGYAYYATVVHTGLLIPNTPRVISTVVTSPDDVADGVRKILEIYLDSRFRSLGAIIGAYRTYRIHGEHLQIFDMPHAPLIVSVSNALITKMGNNRNRIAEWLRAHTT